MCKDCDDNYGGLWPSERKALKNIRSGKTKIIRCTIDELLKELEN